MRRQPPTGQHRLQRLTDRTASKQRNSPRMSLEPMEVVRTRTHQGVYGCINGYETSHLLQVPLRASIMDRHNTLLTGTAKSSTCAIGCLEAVDPCSHCSNNSCGSSAIKN
eukprot:5849220-Amphidinium_carterae.1